MTLENPLMIGIILIAVGLACALIAVAILLNRRDMEKAETGETETVSSDAVGTGDPSTPEGIPAAEVEPLPPEVSEAEQISGEPVETPAADSAARESAPSTEFPVPNLSDDAPRSGSAAAVEQIAAIKRHPGTGRLILSVENREYSSLSELKESSDWHIVSGSLNELVAWIQQEIPESLALSTELSLMEQPAPLQKSKDRKKKPEVLPQPRSMVEQINDIIQEKIRISGKTHLSVRLIESRYGEVKALIGVESYPLEEIPDPQIKEFIRECVAEWERKV
ncbi:MAG: hypothetical protein JXA25_08920 [Anaerolineales bacterium]|nr:hypothetical protein [Anaerolineales bacterium]